MKVKLELQICWDGEIIPEATWITNLMQSQKQLPREFSKH